VIIEHYVKTQDRKLTIAISYFYSVYYIPGLHRQLFSIETMIQIGYECKIYKILLNCMKIIYSDLDLHLKEITKPFIYCKPRGQRKQLYKCSGLSRQRTTTSCIVVLIIHQKKYYKKL